MEGSSYHYEDYTTVTDWEKFIDNLEKQLSAWNLSDHRGFTYNADDFDLPWIHQSDVYKLNDKEYLVCYYFLNKICNKVEHDGDEGDSNQENKPGYLSSSIHHIFLKSTECPTVAYMFDVPEFILVKPKSNESINESVFNLLLSSVTIAVSNIHCGLPVFVQAPGMENFYEGVYFKKKFIGSFEMVHLAKPSEHCLYLSGILEAFKSKIKSYRTANTISVSACFTYTIPNSSIWLGFKQVKHIPLGLTCDPICGLLLSAIWFDSSERLISDSSTYSSLETRSCNYHRISMITAHPLPRRGRLSSFMELILKIATIELNAVTVDWTIVPEMDATTALDIADLDLCTESFDATVEIGNSLVPSLRDIKTAPPNGLVHALALMILRSVDDNASAVRSLWGGFVNVLRDHWKNCVPIPGVKSGQPDPKTCVLHQKLQMLNFCIQSKSAELAEPDKFFDADLSDQESAEEEEFIECKDKSESEDKESAPQALEPEGRKEIVPGLLTLATGEPIYAPFVQEAVHLEEDAEPAHVFEMSLTLSHMEAFKAANPCAFFRDFIRWFSPSDWVEDEGCDQWGQKSGHLSDRMLTPGNKWISLWTRAKPKAAIQQPSIFDQDAHAAAIIEWFDSMTGYKLVISLLPLLAQKAVERLILDEECAFTRDILAEYFTKDLCSALRDLTEQPTAKAYEDFLNQVREVEILASSILSVCDLLKLSNIRRRSEDDTEYDTLKNAVAQLVSGKEVNLSKFNGRVLATSLLGEYEKNYDILNPVMQSSPKTRQFNSFPPPDRKEFILSVMAPRPGPNSKQSPQRMYASVNSRLKDELTLAACFTKDMCYR